MLKESLLKKVEEFSELGLIGDEVREFLIGVFKSEGYNGIVREIRANRNALKNAEYGINKICYDMLTERFDVTSSEVVWYASEADDERVRCFQKKLTDIAYMVLRNNTREEENYLKLRNEVLDKMFILGKKYKELDDMELGDEYLAAFEEVKKLHDEVYKLEDRLDHYVMYHLSN